MKKRIITKHMLQNFAVHLYEEERRKHTVDKYLHDVGYSIGGAGR